MLSNQKDTFFLMFVKWFSVQRIWSNLEQSILRLSTDIYSNPSVVLKYNIFQYSFWIFSLKKNFKIDYNREKGQECDDKDECSEHLPERASAQFCIQDWLDIKAQEIKYKLSDTSLSKHKVRIITEDCNESMLKFIAWSTNWEYELKL